LGHIDWAIQDIGRANAVEDAGIGSQYSETRLLMIFIRTGFISEGID